MKHEILMSADIRICFHEISVVFAVTLIILRIYHLVSHKRADLLVHSVVTALEQSTIQITYINSMGGIKGE